MQAIKPCSYIAPIFTPVMSFTSPSHTHRQSRRKSKQNLRSHTKEKKQREEKN